MKLSILFRIGNISCTFDVPCTLHLILSFPEYFPYMYDWSILNWIPQVDPLKISGFLFLYYSSLFAVTLCCKFYSLWFPRNLNSERHCPLIGYSKDHSLENSSGIRHRSHRICFSYFRLLSFVVWCKYHVKIKAILCIYNICIELPWFLVSSCKEVNKSLLLHVV